MVVQYPHTGKAFTPAESSRDGAGQWAAGATPLSYETRCRIEPNKGSQYLLGQDGNHITFSGIVYMPLSTDSAFEIKPGTLFEVWEGERLIVRSDVKQFSKGQLNMRVWV